MREKEKRNTILITFPFCPNVYMPVIDDTTERTRTTVRVIGLACLCAYVDTYGYGNRQAKKKKKNGIFLYLIIFLVVLNERIIFMRKN